MKPFCWFLHGMKELTASFIRGLEYWKAKLGGTMLNHAGSAITLEQLDETALRRWSALRQSAQDGNWLAIKIERQTEPIEVDGLTFDTRINWDIQYDAGTSSSGIADNPSSAIANMYFSAALLGLLNAVPDSMLAEEFPEHEIFRERILDTAAQAPIDFDGTDPRTDDQAMYEEGLGDRYISALESTCPRCGHVERIELSSIADLQLMATIIRLASSCPACYTADTGDYEGSDSTLAQQELEDFAHDNEIEFCDDGIFGEPFDESSEVE